MCTTRDQDATNSDPHPERAGIRQIRKQLAPMDWLFRCVLGPYGPAALEWHDPEARRSRCYTESGTRPYVRG